MLREGWNFHNDIAVELEGIINNKHGDSDLGRPFHKIYDADVLDAGGTFAECMIEEVRHATDYDSEDQRVDAFVRKCTPYIGMPGSQIEPETAQGLFDEFKSLIGE